MDQWLVKARAEKTALLGSKGKVPTSMVVMPLFRGEYIDLVYNKFVLDTRPYTKEQKTALRASGVPRRLNGDQWNSWGGKTYRKLRVHGVVVNINAGSSDDGNKGIKREPRFIALSVTVSGKYVSNQMLTLGMLHCRGFMTPMRFTGWIEVGDVNKVSLEQRLEVVSQLITKDKAVGPRLPKPVGLELFRSHIIK